MPMDEAEDEQEITEKPNDELHRVVTKAGLLILGFGVLLLLFPLWDVMYEMEVADQELTPYKAQFASLKEEEKSMVAADPESPRLIELKEKQQEVIQQLRDKKAIYDIYKKKMILIGMIMFLSIVIGLITTLVGMYLWSAYRAQFRPPKPEEEEGEEEEQEKE